jgi:hypothetical protein
MQLPLVLCGGTHWATVTPLTQTVTAFCRVMLAAAARRAGWQVEWAGEGGFLRASCCLLGQVTLKSMERNSASRGKMAVLGGEEQLP